MNGLEYARQRPVSPSSLDDPLATGHSQMLNGRSKEKKNKKKDKKDKKAKRLGNEEQHTAARDLEPLDGPSLENSLELADAPLALDDDDDDDDWHSARKKNLG